MFSRMLIGTVRGFALRPSQDSPPPGPAAGPARPASENVGLPGIKSSRRIILRYEARDRSARRLGNIILVLWAFLPALPTCAQMTIVPAITTVAGSGTACSNFPTGCGDGGSATAASLNNAQHVFVDGAGNLYISDNSDNVIRKVVAATGIVTTVAGNGTACSTPTAICGDGGPATSANLNYPNATAVDSAGNIYIADRKDNRIRKVSATTGYISTVAGSGTACATTTAACGDGGAATSANLNNPIDVVLDSAGNTYIADYSDFRVRKVAIATGYISTVAGTGTGCYPSTAVCGDGGLATNANFTYVRAIAFDSVGNGYIADSSDQRIRKVSAATGDISTIAGNGTQCASPTNSCGDSGPATSANLANPSGVAVDAAGNVYIADQSDQRIRVVAAATGLITTIAGTGAQCAASTDTCGDGGAATGADFDGAAGVFTDIGGNIYVADDYDNRIRKVPLNLDFPETAIGSSSTAQNALFETTSNETLSSFTVQASQNSKEEFSIGSISGCTINGSTSNSIGTVCTVPITFSPAYAGTRKVPLTVSTGGGSATFGLSGIAAGPLAAMIPGIISTVAGSGIAGYSGDGSAATSAQLKSPQRIAVDSAGNLYIADQGNNVIRKVAASTGYIATVAGTGTASYSGDGGVATSATLNNPVAVALDAAGNIYITDENNNRIREVSAATGVITTVAGNGSAGYSGDGGAATGAELYTPYYAAVDLAGNLDIVDGYNCRIRRVTRSNGVISTIAGNGTCGYSGDGGAATSAELNLSGAVAVDIQGNLYIPDSNNFRIRKLTASTGLISTVAGNGTSGYLGDGGPASSAEFGQVEDIAVDTAGNLYLPDGANHRVRRVDATTGLISTIAGNGISGYTGDNGAATMAELKQPYDVALDGAGSLYIADLSGEVVRKIATTSSALTYAATTAVGTTDSTDDPRTVTVANIGNTSLTTAVPSSGTNPSVAAHFVYDAASSCPQLTTSSSAATLGAGGSCTVAIDFEPTVAGSVSGSTVLTNDSLNVAGSTQSISLTGTASAVSTTTSLSSSANPSTFGALVTITAAVSPTSGSYLPTGTVQFSVDGVQAGSPVTLSGSATATYATSTLNTAAHSITAVFTPGSSNCTGSTSSALSQVVNKASSSPSISWATPASIPYGTALSATQLDATSTLGGRFVYSPAAGTVLTPGSQTLQATFTPTDTTDYATGAASVALNVTDATPTVTLTPSATNLAHGAALTLTASVASGATPIHPGVITFCDASYSNCLYQAVVGKAQLTSSGKAVIKIMPGIGSRSYKAVFAGTADYNSMSSTSVPVTVTGTFSTTTTISSSGSAGAYTLTGTVVSSGNRIVSPGGTAAFQDTNNGNYTVASGALGSSTVTQTFTTPASNSTIAVSRDVAVGDFNADGIPDVAIVDQSGQKVYILLGNGDGTFTAATGSPVTVSGSLLVGIAAGDFNNDGTIDLAVADYGDNKVFILPGNGDGSFQTPTSVSAHGNPVEIATADFNNDGNLDLAVVEYSGNQVEVLLGDGSGGFAESGAFSTGTGPYSVAVADLNNDGNLDMVVGNSGASSVTVLLGNGAGSFTQSTGSPFAAGSSPSPAALAIGDFNGDGYPDVAVPDSGSSTVSVLLGKGDGTFQSPATLTAQSGQKYLAMADFNGDGNQDLATCDTATGTIYKFLGNGNGTFQSEVSTSTGSTYCSDMGTADFNGDGNPDLVVPMQGNNKAVILLDSLTHTATASAGPVSIPGSGTHNIEASYGGDIFDASSTSSTTALTASKVTTILSLQASPTSSAYGQQVTLTATLSPYSAGNLTSNGETVAFKSGGSMIGSGTLSGGVASVTLSTLTTGTDGLTAIYSTDTNFLASTSSALNFTVSKATPAISWATPAAITYGTALSSTQLNATSGGVAGSFAYSPASGTVPGAGSQTLSVTFTPTDSADYNTATGSVTLTVNKVTPIVTWATPSAITYRTALSSTQLNATSGGVSGNFVYTPASGTVPAAGSQTLSVTFTPTDSIDYNTATGSVTLTVNKASPIVTWATPSAIPYGTALSSTQLNATSGGVAGNFVYLPVAGAVLGAGSQTLSVTFTPTDTIDYNTANGSVNLTIAKANPTLTWSTPAGITYGTALDATQLDATSGGVAGTMVYTPASGTVPGAGYKTLSVTFTPSDSTDYNTANGSVQLTVNKATPLLSWVAPSSITYGTALSATQLDASSGGVAGSFVYSPVSGTVLGAGTQTLSVAFNPSDTTDYNTASGSVSLVVNKTTPAISWATPSAIPYGTALSSTQLDAASGGVAGSFVYSPASGAVLPAGSQMLSVAFTPSDAADYNAANGSVQLAVNKSTPTLTLSSSGTSSTYGASVTFTATISTGPTGSLTFNDGGSSIGTASIGGTSAQFTTTLLAAGSHTITAGWAGDNNYNSITSSAVSQSVTKATPSISWTEPSPIGYGTALSGTQLDASSGGVGGSFIYSPAGGTVLAVDSQTLSVTFTPTDTSDYNSATGSVSLIVNDKVTPTIIWATPSAITYGTPLGPSQLNANSGGVAGTFLYSPASGAVLTAGTQTLWVTFTPSDTSDYNTVVQAVSLTVNKASVVIIGTSSMTPSIFGDLIAASFTFGGAGVTPIGTAIIQDGGVTLGTVTLNAGVAIFNTSALSAGVHLITAVYSGDENYK